MFNSAHETKFFTFLPMLLLGATAPHTFDSIIFRPISIPSRVLSAFTWVWVNMYNIHIRRRGHQIHPSFRTEKNQPHESYVHMTSEKPPTRTQKPTPSTTRGKHITPNDAPDERVTGGTCENVQSVEVAVIS